MGQVAQTVESRKQTTQQQLLSRQPQCRQWTNGAWCWCLSRAYTWSWLNLSSFSTNRIQKESQPERNSYSDVSLARSWGLWLSRSDATSNVETGPQPLHSHHRQQEPP